jgi:hypothetical protein
MSTFSVGLLPDGQHVVVRAGTGIEGGIETAIAGTTTLT